MQWSFAPLLPRIDNYVGLPHEVLVDAPLFHAQDVDARMRTASGVVRYYGLHKGSNLSFVG